MHKNQKYFKRYKNGNLILLHTVVPGIRPKEVKSDSVFARTLKRQIFWEVIAVTRFLANCWHAGDNESC